MNEVDLVCRIYKIYDIIHNYKNQGIVILFILGYVSLIILFLHNYFIVDYSVCAALILAPYIIKPDDILKGSKKYFWLSLVFAILTFITGVQTFYFLTLGFAMLYMIESIFGNTGVLPLFLLGLISPTFKYFNNLLGFPVRLQLSEWTGMVLQLAGYKIEVIGNIFVLNGTEYSVDPACIGLKMMAISILAGLLLISFFQHQQSKLLSFIKVASLLLFIVVLNIFSNLTRILILVVFNILPDNPNHDIVGILCFIFYIIIPSWFLIRWMFRKNTVISIKPAQPGKNLKQPLILNCALFLLLTLAGITKLSQNPGTTKPTISINIEGYSKEIVKEDIIKLEKPGVLIYIKPMQRFYGAEHNPMICWVGSGYQFSRINKQIIGGKELYSGILKKGRDILFSAWWFDNGTYQTSGQMDWRWRAMKGEKFFLVNINSTNEQTLKEEISLIINANKKDTNWANQNGLLKLNQD